MGNLTLLDPDGNPHDVPESEAPHFLSNGYRLDTDTGAIDRAVEQAHKDEFGGVGGGVRAGILGVGRGLTLGLSDVALRGIGGEDSARRLRGLEAENPTISTVSQIAGALAPSLLTGGAGLLEGAGGLAEGGLADVGSLLERTPAGFTTRIGAKIAGEGGIVRTAAAGAVEGAAQNAGSYVSDVALGDRDLSAEGFLGAMGKGALYGGVAGGALSVAHNGLIAARRLLPSIDATPEMVAAAKIDATRAIRDSVDTSASLERTGQKAVSDANRESEQFLADLEAERNAALKQTAEARPESVPAVEPMGEPVAAPRDPRELMQAWRAKYPEGAVDFNAANAAARRSRLAEWAEGFQPANAEDEAIKAYFQSPQDPARTMQRLGGAEVPAAVQKVARDAAADASHQAYLDATAQATNVADSGTELMARATYAGRRAAARTLDDVYTAYRAGTPIADIRAAATRKLTGELRELADARADMIQSLAKQPDVSSDLLAKLTGTKQALDEGVPLAKQTLGERILRGVEKPLDPDEAIAKALGKTKDANVDIAELAPKITRYEAAKAQLTESLGPKASPDALAHAQAFRQAQQEASADSARQVAQATDNIDKTLRGVPEEARAGGKSIIGGLAKKASQFGQAYELASSLGLPLPSLHSIPVIGPILSLFLKAKIVGKLAGRFGGSFAATAEGTIAAKAAETQNRIYGALDKMLSGATYATGGAAKAVGAAAPASEALAHKLFDDGTRAPYTSSPKAGKAEDEYRARIAELTAAMQPGAIEDAVRSRITTSDPTIVDAILAAQRRGLTYLYNAAPKPDAPRLPDDRPFMPSKAELDEFTTTLGAYHDPAAVYEKVANGGTSRPSEVECVKNCYPQLYTAAQMRAVQMLVKGKRPRLYAQRIALSNLVGVPMDATMTPSRAASLQGGWPSPAAAQAPTPHPTLSGNVSIGDRTLTRLDR